MSENAKRVVTMVLTGGPCAGKSTAMEWLMRDLPAKGWKVIFVPEVATELINAGLSPKTLGGAAGFQMALSKIQLFKEQFYRQCADQIADNKVLIVFDRGLMDGSAYLTKDEFQSILQAAGLTKDQVLQRYDMVFHLVTAAKGAVQHYKTSNNQARTETAEEAAALDDRLIAAWKEHPHIRVIGNESGFEAKMEHLLTEVAQALEEMDAR